MIVGLVDLFFGLWWEWRFHRGFCDFHSVKTWFFCWLLVPFCGHFRGSWLHVFGL